jgi:GH25 family lysozyme M1 (1,4-beta-N-acetylmuramidase)
MKRLIDISYHQDPPKIDYDKLLSQVDGVIVRCGYGTGVEWKGWGNSPDPAFDKHYSEVKKAGLPVGAYHYLVEYKTVDAQIGIIKRALDGKELDHIKVWDGEKYVEQLAFFADIELEGGAEPLTRKSVIEYITKLEAFFGEPIGIYTGAWCWNPIMGSDNPFSSRLLWVAGYPNPILPYGWSGYWIHQRTSSGRLEGYAGNLDINDVEDNKWTVSEGTPPDIIGPLQLTQYSQKDPRWENEKLGTSSVTIGAYGCLITAASMVCDYFGKDTDPSRLNKALIEVKGYESGNLLRYNAITTIYPDIEVRWDYFISNPSDAQIDEVLVQELPVIAQVDYNPNTSALDQHWVVIVGKENDEYLIVDPIDGSTAYLSRYAGKAFRMVVYEQQELNKCCSKFGLFVMP